jgi:hypothetical protein
MLVSSFNLSQSFITRLISFAKKVQIRDQLFVYTDQAELNYRRSEDSSSHKFINPILRKI